MYITCEPCNVKFDYNLQDEVNHCMTYAKNMSLLGQ